MNFNKRNLTAILFIIFSCDLHSSVVTNVPNTQRVQPKTRINKKKRLETKLITKPTIDPRNNPKIKIIDKVLGIIYQADGPSVIMQSDLRAGLDGAPKTIKDLILERLMVLDAQNLKITITDTDVDRHLIQVQKQFKLTKEDTIELFKQMGYTFEEGREQLRIKLMIDNVIDYRVKSKVLIDKKEIEKYYLDHPDIEYKVSQAFYPFNGGSPALNRIKIERAIEDNDIDNIVTWSESIILKDEQIAQDKQFIKELAPNKSAIVNITEEGIFLIKSIVKHIRPLQERENEINNILGQTLFAKAFADYHQKLLNTAAIKFTDSEAQKAYDELVKASQNI